MARRILILHNHDFSPQPYLHLFSGFDVLQLEQSKLQLDRLTQQRFDLIAPMVADDAPWLDDLLQKIRDKPIAVPVFPILSTETGAELLRLVSEVAADFAVWPTRACEVQQRLLRIVGRPQADVDLVSDRLTEELGLAMLVGKDPAFLDLIAKVRLVARSDSPVLITGETGTGKELSARAIHHLSRRRSNPFIAVDCGAFPEHLFENEMFGHTRGAFTDAHRDQRGLIAMAEGGTLFLDEVDSLAPSSQAKLLRFLQEHTYRPLGSDKFLHAEVNVLAASNRDLEQLVSEHRFRADLFFRLNVLRLHMIPLRDRKSDIPILAQHFLKLICAERSYAPRPITTAAIEALMRMEWRGNVRELYNVINRAVILALGRQIVPADVSPSAEGSADAAALNPEGFRQARAHAIEAFERNYVLDTLRKHHGNITQSARYAHQDRRAFGRLVKRYGIDRNSI